MPAAVTELENAVDEAAGSERWIATDATTIPSLVAEGWGFRGGRNSTRIGETWNAGNGPLSLGPRFFG